MLICEKLFEKEFTKKSMKGAYLKCSKWFASNVLAINNSQNILHHIEKVNPKGNIEECAKVRLSVYVCAEETEIKEKHCEICQEVSGAFYMAKRNHMCENCKMLPYRRRMEDKIDTMKKALKGVIGV